MAKYVVCCPNCGEIMKKHHIRKTDHNYFECECGEEFDIERADIEESEED